MAKFRCGGGGSPDIVNGVIEEYLAESEDISANTFVEFVNDTLLVGGASLPSSISDGATLSVKRLTDTSIVVLFDSYIAVYEVVNDSIVYSTSAELTDSMMRERAFEVIDENHLLIIGQYYDTSASVYGSIYYRICTLSGSSLTFSDRAYVYEYSTLLLGWYSQMVRINRNKIYLKTEGNSGNLYSAILTIDNDYVVTCGSFCALSASRTALSIFPYIEIIDDTRILMVLYNTSAERGWPGVGTYAGIISLSGTVITYNDFVYIGNSNNSGGGQYVINGAKKNNEYVIVLPSSYDFDVFILTASGVTISIDRSFKSVKSVNSSLYMTYGSMTTVGERIIIPTLYSFETIETFCLGNTIIRELPNIQNTAVTEINKTRICKLDDRHIVLINGSARVDLLVYEMAIKKSVSDIRGLTKTKTTNTTKGKIWEGEI